MFFDAERILAVRQMILADDLMGRKAALAKLLPMQRGDFHRIFRIMAGLPVTIRLLDPPLHEFIPHTDEEIAQVAKAAGSEPAKLRARALALAESNPMLGHRGCRLGITYPEIYEMQARAILEAALDAENESGKAVELEIMIPLICFKSELDFLRDRIAAVADAIKDECGKAPAYMIGTMIELPRAALMAKQIAETAEFFSFGTNDLTQTTLGVSRDDAGSFLSDYLARGLIERDPSFRSIAKAWANSFASRLSADAAHGPRSNSEFAASMAAIPTRFVSAMTRDWTTSRVRRFGFPWRVLRRPKRRSKMFVKKIETDLTLTDYRYTDEIPNVTQRHESGWSWVDTPLETLLATYSELGPQSCLRRI